MSHQDQDQDLKESSLSVGEQIQAMQKMFSAQLGISMADIQKVFDAQFHDWMQNFQGVLIERNALKKRVEELERILLEHNISLTPPVEKPPEPKP